MVERSGCARGGASTTLWVLFALRVCSIDAFARAPIRRVSAHLGRRFLELGDPGPRHDLEVRRLLGERLTLLLEATFDAHLRHRVDRGGAFLRRGDDLLGLDARLADGAAGSWPWIAVAVGFNVLSFAAYVALFRGVIGDNVASLDWKESYQITMAGLAASRIVSAGGAGGVVLSYWALRKAGMERAEAARRMVAFMVLLYSVYIATVIIFGVLLRTGVLPGEAPVSVTIVPAAIAGGLAIVLLLIALIPGDLQGRLSFDGQSRVMRLVVKLSTVPATVAQGIRTARAFLRNPRKGGLAMGGAIGFWAANIGILWASFEAFGESVPIGVIVMGFFVGMVGNLIPDPAGVGGVDAGLIGTFVIFGFPADTVIAAVLVYRMIRLLAAAAAGHHRLHPVAQDGGEVGE